MIREERKKYAEKNQSAKKEEDSIVAEKVNNN
jgi:hypothetical protein